MFPEKMIILVPGNMMIQTPVTYQFTYGELNIDRSLVEQLMGYTDPGSCPDPVMESIEAAMSRGPDLCNVRGGYVIAEGVKVDRENKQIISHGQTFNTKQIVTHQMRRAQHAAWFLCTAGEDISAYARRLMDEGELIGGYAADVLANAVVESAMDRIQEDLKKKSIEAGMMITNRYSPGYCDWDIAEQQKLFSIFDNEFLGITLSSSSLMHPMKSVSGVIGIGKEVKFNAYTCNLCNQGNCLYRNSRS